MPLHPLAGKPAPADLLIDVQRLEDAYYANRPDLANPTQRVAFGTSGHRGSALNGSFNEAHILAIAQAVAEYRVQAGINGPLFLGKDTHALSDPAQRTTLEVLAANGVLTHLQANDFPRKLDGSKHQPDRKANGQAYGNLLCNRAECFRTVQGNNGLIYQRRLRAQCDEKREPNLGAHGDSAQRKQRRHRKHSQNP